MTIPKDNSQLENARRLRSEMTPHERKLWYLFLRKYPVKIYKQRIIGRFIVDFYCASAKLVIELDGSQPTLLCKKCTVEFIFQFRERWCLYMRMGR